MTHSPFLATSLVLFLVACGGSGGATNQGGMPIQSTPPSFTSQPTGVTVSVGSVAMFSVTAAGSAPLSYQWQMRKDTETTWSSAPGSAQSANYVTQATAVKDNGYFYRVQVSNSAGTATSDAALLTVIAALPSVERQVNATLTDSNITAIPSTVEAPHLAINPSASVNQRGKLLVFLPGTQGRPSQYSYILRAGAARGFHALGLNYANQTAMGTLCQFSADPDCYWNARNVVIFGNGTPVNGQSAVTPADSLVNRLNKLLNWLNNANPSEGWSQFLLSNKNVDWSKVVLAGHSQGGGHVGILAKTVSLSRAIYFSSPEDWNESSNRPASWTASKPNVTPANLQYGFGSGSDTLVPNAHAFAHWDNLGLTKPASGPVLVDGVSQPFSNSHQLYTLLPFNPSSLALTLALKNHGISVVDASTPLDGNGKPLFDTNGVWEYLCFQ
ncbi:BPSS1187 family protein [Undibacterium sp. Di24W]|uniref:BPSS1187 family protein n=1 Tax=Undibacterium sp. Di24W TaxID=3413033 RepID=UPI003BF22C6B